MTDNNFYVYIVKCNDDSYYTGHTDDLEKRLAEHASGCYESYTSSRFQSNWFIQKPLTVDIQLLLRNEKLKNGQEQKKKF